MAGRAHGTVESIYLAEQESGPTRPMESVRAVAERGLAGDRYFPTEGAPAEPGTAITLIECEALEAVVDEHRIDLRGGRSRRQVHTRGIDLNALVGREFLVGDVRCRGVELCEPCTHLQGMTEPGVIDAFVHRGGLRADLLSSGEIRVGASVQPLPE